MQSEGTGMRKGEQKREAVKQKSALPHSPPEASGRPNRKPSAAAEKRKKAPRHMGSSVMSDPGRKRPYLPPRTEAPARAIKPVSTVPLAATPGQEQKGEERLARDKAASLSLAAAGPMAAEAAEQGSEDSFALYFSTEDEDASQDTAAPAAGARDHTKQSSGTAKARSSQDGTSQRRRKGRTQEPGSPGLQHVRPPRDAAKRQTPVPTVCFSPMASWPLKGYSASAKLVGMADVVQWLRGTAATGGRLNAPSCVTPAETAPPEWQPAAVERRYRTALARCRSLMHALPPDAAAAAGRRRRSSRARHTPDVYIPGLDTPGSGLRRSGRRVVPEEHEGDASEDSDDEPPELLEGEEYQAVLPPLRPRPKRPSSSEAAWLQHRLLPAGAWDDPSRRVRIQTSTDVLVCRVMRTETGVLISEQLQKDLGVVNPLLAWSEREVDIFQAVLERDGKDVDLMASQLAPRKSVGDVVQFYYCVWKAQLVPQAKLWYAHRKLEKERAVEEEKAEETAASVAAQKKAAVVRAERRRQLKNALLWQRESVRTPLDLNTTRAKVLERLLRARELLMADNVRKMKGSSARAD